MHPVLKSRRARFAAAGAVALAVGLLASFGAVSYAARLVGATDTSPTAAQYPPSKVTICHHTHSKKHPFVTITVSEHAVPAHLRNHGDTIGPCPTGVAQTAAPVAPAAKKQKPQHAAAKAKVKVKLKKAKKAKKTHPSRSSVQESATQPASQATPKSTAHGNSDAAKAKVKTKSHGNAHGHDKQQAKQQGSAKSQSHGQDKTKEHGQGNGSNGNGNGGKGGNGGNGNGGGNGKGH